MSEPIVKMDAAGKASIISYNVPEPTSYSGKNIIEIEFEDSWFTAEAKAIPENRKKNLSNEDVTRAIENATERNVIDPRVFPNIVTRGGTLRNRNVSPRRR